MGDEFINNKFPKPRRQSECVYTFLTAFKSMGYKVRIEESKDTSYSTWKKNDIIVWSCGDDYSPINTCKMYSLKN